MAAVSRATLAASIATLLADNESGDISAADVRSILTDLEDSVIWHDEDAAGVADGSYGQITVTSGVWSIDAGTVTLAQIASAAKEGGGTKLLTTDGSVAEGSLYSAGSDGKAVAASTATAGTISAKTTLVDADQVLIFDSEASNGLKKVTATSFVANYIVAEFPAASATTQGKVELATVAETSAGTDATRAVTPDGLAGSVYGEAAIQLEAFAPTEDVAVGNGAAYFHVPSTLNGFEIVAVVARVITAGTTGTTDIQLHNVTSAADMLSTKLTIDSGEVSSATAATAAVINTAEDDLTTGDLIRVDVDAVSTTAPGGLLVTMIARKP